MEGSAHYYTLSQLRAWKNRILQQREQLDREELFVEQRMAGLLEEEEEEKRKNFKRKRMKVNLQKEKVLEEGESEESDWAEEGESDSAEKAAKKKKILKKVNLKKRVESEEAAECYAEEGADSEWYEGETEEWYAWKWVKQNGEDYGIPKQYTPCVYFFKNHDCQKEEKCEWSHNEDIFLKEPFADCLKNLSW